MARLQEDVNKTDDPPLQVVVVGNGAPHFAEAFRNHFDVEFPIFTDPDLSLFHRLSFKRGVGGLFSATMWKRGFEAFRDGYRQGKTEGDALQLGGVVGVRADGEVCFYHASAFAGDHPEWIDVVQAFG